MCRFWICNWFFSITFISRDTVPVISYHQVRVRKGTKPTFFDFHHTTSPFIWSTWMYIPNAKKMCFDSKSETIIYCISIFRDIESCVMSSQWPELERTAIFPPIASLWQHLQNIFLHISSCETIWNNWDNNILHQHYMRYGIVHHALPVARSIAVSAFPLHCITLATLQTVPRGLDKCAASTKFGHWPWPLPMK